MEPMPDPSPSLVPPDAMPGILVFDSGLGGLTVLAEIDRLRGSARRVYAADDAVFPYGDLAAADLVARVLEVMAPLIDAHRPDIVVVACNTASTAVLPPLRARWPDLAFVGTVPAIKPAAATSVSRRVSVLATPATVARDYTRDLVRAFSGDCAVDLVGAPHLAGLAETWLRGGGVVDDLIAREIAPAFVERDGRRTDTVVLACTHYPLLLPRLERIAPWGVRFLDPAPAVARRVDAVLSERGFPAGAAGSVRRGLAVSTSGRASEPALARILADFRLDAEPSRAR